MRINIICSFELENPLIEDRDNRKVYGVKVVLYARVLLRYRYDCFGTILALIHPYKQEDFNTLKTHYKSLFS